jgi:hypothetical protein
VEHGLGDPRLDALEHRHVDRAGRVVQREEDDPLPAADRGGLRGHLHPDHEDPFVGPAPPQVLRARCAQVGDQRLEEAHEVPARVQAEHLELGADPLGVRVLGKLE